MNILPELVEERRVSLEEVLLSRDMRQERQQEWMSRYAVTLISLTIVVPGECKDTLLSRRAFNIMLAVAGLATRGERLAHSR